LRIPRASRRRAVSRFRSSAGGGAWLAPAFRDGSIDADLSRIRCPLPAIRGDQDEYGTLAQVRGIAARVPGTRLEVLRGCGHAPQRDEPAKVAATIAGFVAMHAMPVTSNEGGGTR
jgi:pimeloyl-ACP methyl ester carboxylesterase